MHRIDDGPCRARGAKRPTDTKDDWVWETSIGSGTVSAFLRPLPWSGSRNTLMSIRQVTFRRESRVPPHHRLRCRVSGKASTGYPATTPSFRPDIDVRPTCGRSDVDRTRCASPHRHHRSWDRAGTIPLCQVNDRPFPMRALLAANLPVASKRRSSHQVQTSCDLAQKEDHHDRQRVATHFSSVRRVSERRACAPFRVYAGRADVLRPPD